MSDSEEKAKAPGLAKRLQSWTLQGMVLLMLVLAFEAFLSRDALGVVAPVIESETLAEERFSLQQFRGKPAVVHFWASWCPICELEQGMVDALADEVPMITVAMQSGTSAEVRDYMAGQEVGYPVVNDEQGTLSARYGVKAVPASFVLDSEGRVRFATRGYTTGWGLQVRLWLAGLF